MKIPTINDREALDYLSRHDSCGEYDCRNINYKKKCLFYTVCHAGYGYTVKKKAEKMLKLMKLKEILSE